MWNLASGAAQVHTGGNKNYMGHILNATMAVGAYPLLPFVALPSPMGQSLLLPSGTLCTAAPVPPAHAAAAPPLSWPPAAQAGGLQVAATDQHVVLHLAGTLPGGNRLELLQLPLPAAAGELLQWCGRWVLQVHGHADGCHACS